MIPQGKGVFLWNVPRCDPSEDKAGLVARLLAAGIQRVDIKIVDGTTRYGIDKETGFNHVAAAIRAMRKSGIMVTGWAYTYGYSRDWVTKEAGAVVEALRDYEIDIFSVDAEVEYKRENHAKWADIYCRTIRDGVPGLTMGLTSYRFPEYHTNFPWGAFWPYVEFHMPQVYWINAHNPVWQLNESIRQLKKRFDIPIVPAGYGYGGVQPEEMNAFNCEVQRLGLAGISWWEWYYIDSDPNLFEALRSHDWGAVMVPEPEPVPEPDDEVDRLMGEIAGRMRKI